MGKYRRALLKERSDKLNKDVPASEAWFRKLWQDHGMMSGGKARRDKFNHPLGYYIPDVVNTHYKYVIEIDGSIHDTESQKKRDFRKDCYYWKKGYRVYRVKAYDLDSFYLVLNQVKTIARR